MAKLLVNIDVPDLTAAVDFYTQAFALTVGRRFGKAAVELLGAEAPIYLLAKPAEKPPFPGAQVARSYQRHWTPVHFDFEVEDLDRAVATALAAGARLDGDAALSEHAWGRMALLSDPFGHGFCLLQLSAAGYDAMTAPP